MGKPPDATIDAISNVEITLGTKLKLGQLLSRDELIAIAKAADPDQEFWTRYHACARCHRDGQRCAECDGTCRAIAEAGAAR